MKSVISMALVSIGIISAGYFVGDGLGNIRSSKKVIHTKGIGEKNVDADFAIWTIKFFVNSDNFQEAKQQYEVDLGVIKDFLNANDFKTDNIEVQVPNIEHRVERDAQNNYAKVAETFEVLGTVVIKTSDVMKVEKVSQNTFQLLQKGIWLKGDQYQTNPKYIITDFDRFRPEIFAQAIDSSYRMAKELAKKSDVKIKRVTDVDQGNFSIRSRIGNENEEAYREKKVRVVSYVTYEIE
ncbi:MAG: SIMPL domain-containing protein [Alphaproteobacteria bacterium]